MSASANGTTIAGAGLWFVFTANNAAVAIPVVHWRGVREGRRSALLHVVPGVWNIHGPIPFRLKEDKT